MQDLYPSMDALRGPDGCPWDKEQDLTTLIPFIIEEAYEVVAAIESGEPESLKEELGDHLFQVVFASRLAKESGDFDIGDVIKGCADKMIRRHPHVFGEEKADSSSDVLRHWARVKSEEKPQASVTDTLKDVPESFPALLRAHKVSEKAAKVGFDWNNVENVLDKVFEEIEEFKESLRDKDIVGAEEEIGDILFALVNLSRFIEVNPEDALRKTIGKFITRFHYVEKKIESNKANLRETSIEEMERLWQEAKKI